MERKEIIAILMAVCSILSCGATIVDEMQPYVQPASTAARPAGYVYMPDGESYLVLGENGKSLVQYDVKSGEEVGVYLDLTTTREERLDYIEGFVLSGDGKKVLVWTDSKAVYRRSFKARYYVYDTHSRILSPLSSVYDYQQSPMFSPDGRMVAFVAENNIYIKKLDYKTEVAVTKDGELNKVINGIPDWVYEEEFSTTCSMAWSPDNLTLCYLRYDESAVPMYDLQLYAGGCEPKTQYALYPGLWSYKYPVAGQPNSKVTLHSYDVLNRKTKDITFEDREIEYIPRIQYGPSEEGLIVLTLNRNQNRLEIYSVNPKSTVTKSLYVEEADTWVAYQTYEDIWFGADFFVLNSWKSGYLTLYQINYNGVQIGQISDGKSDVTAYYGCDANGTHYYQESAPSALHRVVRSKDKKGKVTDLSVTDGTASATFSPDMRYMMLCYSSVTQVPTYTLCTSNGKTIRVVEDNADYAAKTLPRLAQREFFTCTSDGVTLNGYVIKPKNYVSGKKYPTLMYQYSGPQSQEVLNRWSFGWQDAFAAAGYVVVCVDGRGTGGRGRVFCDIVYRNLGYYETKDQLAAAQYASTLPYVDSAKIGIFGWSYGGYEALMAASADNSPYAAAVAVAPVTDWRYYDTVYAERFMQTPQQNDDGFNESAPINRAENLSCPLLLMYGTADDNVHPANTLEYVSRLQNAGILCDMFVFPNMNHSIYYCNARAVVYAKMLDWCNKNLK